MESIAEEADKAKGYVNSYMDNDIVKQLVSNVDKNILQKARIAGGENGLGILSPYNYLYATEMTGFRYVFPLITDQDFYALTNMWGTSNEKHNSIFTQNYLTNLLHVGADLMANTVGSDIPNIMNVLSKNSSGANRSSVFEMARYFNFDTDNTDEIKLNFVLYNTVVKNGKIDQWKRNLYFISLFNMRNLPFKLDYTTYLPPLLYDVIIPGVKRLPFTYVSEFTAAPLGLIRNMKIDNFLAKICGAKGGTNENVSVPIPEAWSVSVTFKSMLGRSANLMLAGGADLPISINMNNNEYSEYSNSIKDLSQEVEKLEFNWELPSRWVNEEEPATTAEKKDVELVAGPQTEVNPTTDRMISSSPTKVNRVDLGLSLDSDPMGGMEGDGLSSPVSLPQRAEQPVPASSPETAVPVQQMQPMISNIPSEPGSTPVNNTAMLGGAGDFFGQLTSNPVSLPQQPASENIPTSAAPLGSGGTSKTIWVTGDEYIRNEMGRFKNQNIKIIPGT